MRSKEKSVKSFADVKKCDTARFATYFRLSLENGVYMAPSQYEADFVSAAHSENDIQKTMVGGQENFWIRVKIAGGDYGREKFIEFPDGNDIW